MTTLVELNWRPIKDAPRDGSEILALLENGWIVLMSYPVGVKRFAWWRTDYKYSVPVEDTHDSFSLYTTKALYFIECKDLRELPKLRECGEAI